MSATTTTTAYARGAMFGLAAVGIWAGWIVAARLGLKSSLSPWDITAIRFGVAGLLLLPFLLRTGWHWTASARSGSPPSCSEAVRRWCWSPMRGSCSRRPRTRVPCSRGLMPLQVAVLASLLLGEAFTRQKRVGSALVLAGVLAVVWGAGGTLGTSENLGDALFLAAGFLWACYTVAMRRARLGGLHAAAIAAVGSLVFYLPPYLAFAGASLLEAPWRDVALQALVQGVLTAVVSLLLYGRAVALLDV
jgi:drug/metabolite transporter (DMT)-like permease